MLNHLKQSNSNKEYDYTDCNCNVQLVFQNGRLLTKEQMGQVKYRLKTVNNKDGSTSKRIKGRTFNGESVVTLRAFQMQRNLVYVDNGKKLTDEEFTQYNNLYNPFKDFSRKRGQVLPKFNDREVCNKQAYMKREKRKKRGREGLLDHHHSRKKMKITHDGAENTDFITTPSDTLFSEERKKRRMYLKDKQTKGLIEELQNLATDYNANLLPIYNSVKEEYDNSVKEEYDNSVKEEYEGSLCSKKGNTSNQSQLLKQANKINFQLTQLRDRYNSISILINCRNKM